MERNSASVHLTCTGLNTATRQKFLRPPIESTPHCAYHVSAKKCRRMALNDAHRSSYSKKSRSLSFWIHSPQTPRLVRWRHVKRTTGDTAGTKARIQPQIPPPTIPPPPTPTPPLPDPDHPPIKRHGQEPPAQCFGKMVCQKCQKCQTTMPQRNRGRLP